MIKLYLVEIKVKDWLPDLKTDGRTVAYEEVEIHDDGDQFTARDTGFDQFVNRAKYTPSIRKMLEDNNLELNS